MNAQVPVKGPTVDQRQLEFPSPDNWNSRPAGARGDPILVSLDAPAVMTPKRGKPRPPKVARTPRVVELLRQAQAWKAQLASGEVRNQAEIASREGVTRGRVTQIMGMLRLDPEIQERILALREVVDRPCVTERALRSRTGLGRPSQQRRAFASLVAR